MPNDASSEQVAWSSMFTTDIGVRNVATVSASTAANSADNGPLGPFFFGDGVVIRGSFGTGEDGAERLGVTN